MRRFIALLVLLTLLVAVASVTAQDSGFTRHLVRPGENLYRIALRYNVSIASILAANPNVTNRNLIFAGTTLLIPSGSAATPTPIPPPPVTPQPEQQYTVVRGDILMRIAQRFGTTVTAIAQRNGIANPNRIFPGQVLIIPAPGAVSTPPPPAPGQPRPTATPLPPPTQPGQPPAATDEPSDMVFELGGQVFGFQFASLMRSSGMTWVKRQVVWNLGDPASSVQGVIDEAHNQNFKILLSIKGNPAQIAANPSQYYQNFASFLGGVAGLGPDAIEVWNEQNIDREWPSGQISPQAYSQMLIAAYNAIKAADPAVMVISGAPAPTGFFGGACTTTGCDDAPFLQGMRTAGAAAYMDCVGIHYNEGVLSPDARSGDPRGNSDHYTRYYPTMVETYNAIFPNKPLCFTELGYLSPQGYGPLPDAFSWASDVTVEDQAAWLARAAAKSRDEGLVRLMIIWNVDATEYGADPQAGYAIVRPDNTCLACNTLSAVLQ
jgi:LysM repeat protein